MLRGSIERIGKWNATVYDDRFDAQPGRVIHQRQRSPLALLQKNPFFHYYGDYSAPGWFVIDVAWHFFLTGDVAFFRAMQDKVLATLEWMDRDGDRDGDGFYEYATRAGAWGEKNQGWKDSNDAILYEDGRLVRDPIALCEIQGCYYAAKQLIAVVFESIGETSRATALKTQAHELKQRFNQAFWLPDEGYFALALDPDKRPVRSIAADAGQCLAYGIVADELSGPLVKRLFQPDLFTGWGLRTLSSRHPAFNPFAYHLGSVWPVANATIGGGCKRYGFAAELNRIAQGLFEASRLFELNRLPEVFGGHDRDCAHPHPGIYPGANSPQAWSASAIIHTVQSMLGLFPAAPWGALIVNPDLPEWLPEITLTDVRVGDGRANIRFWRSRDGATEHEVLASNGRLRVHRYVSPAGRDGWPGQLAGLMEEKAGAL
jgi:glycogen debranching enzyme